MIMFERVGTRANANWNLALISRMDELPSPFRLLLECGVPIYQLMSLLDENAVLRRGYSMKIDGWPLLLQQRCLPTQVVTYVGYFLIQGSCSLCSARRSHTFSPIRWLEVSYAKLIPTLDEIASGTARLLLE